MTQHKHEVTIGRWPSGKRVPTVEKLNNDQLKEHQKTSPFSSAVAVTSGTTATYWTVMIRKRAVAAAVSSAVVVRSIRNAVS
jgi:hypothetical protein